MMKQLKLSIFLILSFALAQAQDTIRLGQTSSFIITKKTDLSDTPKTGDIITMRLKKYSPQGVLIFNTSEINPSKGVEITLADNIPSGDILQVFYHLKKGEKALAYIPVWLADRDSSKLKSNELYSYEIELIDFITQKDLKKKQKRLLKQLKKEQYQLFNDLAQTFSPTYQITFKKDGLFILQKDGSRTKKKNRIQTQQNVSVHYILKLLPSMHELDNSYKRSKPLQVKVDAKEVIKGWDIALKQLEVGEKAIVMIPSWLAYGFTGTGHEIPPNTPLLFIMEIVE